MKEYLNEMVKNRSFDIRSIVKRCVKYYKVRFLDAKY